jgi:hypothetical protein
LTYSDLNRIIKYIDKSIFDKECCIWKGYISTMNNNNHYINFFFKDKKVNLHKLLYYNFIGTINKNEYIKFTCENQGKCCNINHLIKYISADKKMEDNNEKDEENNEKSDIDTDEENNSDDFKIIF